MLQICDELRPVKFTGVSLARVIPLKSPVQRAFLAADLHRGELVRPTLTQAAMCCHVSVSHIHHAVKRLEDRALIEVGLRPLVVPASKPVPMLSAPVPMGDADLAILAAAVGPDRWLSAAAQAGI